MRSFPTLVATLAAIPSALAFTYSVGVGKSEVTGEPAYAGFDPSRCVPVPPPPLPPAMTRYLRVVPRVLLSPPARTSES